ncbi:hypothetical protein SAMN05444274_107127 [Mariniphaga anaerophila]|uniref:Uncharacterized protein n=1 Tax=Mariniphaga anaerophila TaxID=1484053 RepID=A0A1M5DJ79_9BACT|nr:hypothetical protein SAMN05444274_107127 [Mariniphaga anaerophila]
MPACCKIRRKTDFIGRIKYEKVFLLKIAGKWRRKALYYKEQFRIATTKKKHCHNILNSEKVTNKLGEQDN